MVRQTISGFLLVGQAPLFSCAVETVLWDSCHVSALADSLLSPCHYFPVRFFVCVFVWLGGL